MSSLLTSIQETLEILVPRIIAHRDSTQNARPLILGITGLQGSGKSTWAAGIVEALNSTHHLHTITVSLDDFYHTHSNLVARRDKDPENKLYRTRGQPGTHDEQLAQETLQALRSWDDERVQNVAIPSFDKSKFNGEGDRAPLSAWPQCSSKPDVIVFEGWCVGFQSLSETAIRSKHEAARLAPTDDSPDCIVTLPDHQLSHLEEVNKHLKQYNETFMGPEHFDFLVHLDTDDLRNVYRWRMQQEHAMLAVKGEGMSDEGVRAFVRGYMPAYELYLEELRGGFFDQGRGMYVRVLMDRDRRVQRVEV